MEFVRTPPVQVVIVGGGFAGIEIARRLGLSLKENRAARVTLVSSENYFLFQPLLPEVVACSIETSHIVTSVRHLCPNVQYRWGTVEAVDVKRQQLTLIGADVVGASSVPGMNEHALPLKTLGDARFNCQITFLAGWKKRKVLLTKRIQSTEEMLVEKARERIQLE